MILNREEILHLLQSISPGLASRESIEQSTCFAVTNGVIASYNEEAMCRAPTPFGKFTGAIPAKPLLEMLSKITDDEVDFEFTDECLIIKRKRGKTRIRIETAVVLAIDKVQKPKLWKSLPEGFLEALETVANASDDSDPQIERTCTHLHPKWIEACDGYQVCRWPIKTGLVESILVRTSTVKNAVGLGATEWAETPSWLHFRNEARVVLACPRYLGEFRDLTNFINVEGEEAELPKGLVQASERSEVFSEENADNPRLHVDLMAGKMRVKGIGVSGDNLEWTKVKYAGDPVSFQIKPNLLAKAVEKKSKCIIAEGRLKVDGGQWIWVTVLGKPKKVESSKE